MITERWFKLSYVEEQQRLLRSTAKWKAVVAGRGSGKTEIARRYLAMNLLEKKPWPDPMYFYVLPTADQARRVAWEPLKKLIPRDWIKGDPHETRMEITTIFGSKLFVCSGDKPSRLEGVQWDGGIQDESSDQKPTLFTLSLLPAMVHRNPWFWMIGVPKRTGPGAAAFKEFFDSGVTKENPKIDSFTWMSKEVLTNDELEQRKAFLTAADFREQFEASWESASGLVFCDFSNENISAEAVYHPGLPIYVGSDFNVDPMAWVLCHFIKGKLHIFEEIYLRNVTTVQTLKYLSQRYPNHPAGWIFMGDATSRARRTSASVSDYLHIVNDVNFKDKHLQYPQANPPIQDRVASANAALCNALGERRVLINPSCKNLIRDFKFRAYMPETSIIDDPKDIGHISDAATYVMWQLFPLQLASPNYAIASPFTQR